MATPIAADEGRQFLIPRALEDWGSADRVVGYNERRDSFTLATGLILVFRKSGKPKFNKSAAREPFDAATIAQ